MDFWITMEINDFSALQLAMSACIGIQTLAVTHNTPINEQEREKALETLQAVKEVLNQLENAKRNEYMDMAYAVLYDAYHKTEKAIYGDFSQDTKN